MIYCWSFVASGGEVKERQAEEEEKSFPIENKFVVTWIFYPKREYESQVEKYLEFERFDESFFMLWWPPPPPACKLGRSFCRFFVSRQMRKYKKHMMVTGREQGAAWKKNESWSDVM